MIAALGYGIAAIERSEDHPPPMPTVLLSQARLAVRHGVELQTVVRRCVAVYTLLGDFLIEESARGGLLNGAALRRLLRVEAALLDRVIAALSEEYVREAKTRPGSADQRLARLVERLLEGQLLDTSEVPYDFEAMHLGTVARGSGAAEALRDLASTLDRSRLLVVRDGGAWGWLGGRRALDPAELARAAASCLPAGVSLAVGEPGEGLLGWRLSHRQAAAALPIAATGAGNFARYRDVALLASVLRDDLLAISLHQLYLDPLSDERDGGSVLRETLRAYIAAERNVSSAAAALGVKRHTVTNRLRTIEERLGRSLATCATEVDAALRLDDLERTSDIHA